MRSNIIHRVVKLRFEMRANNFFEDVRKEGNKRILIEKINELLECLDNIIKAVNSSPQLNSEVKRALDKFYREIRSCYYYNDKDRTINALINDSQSLQGYTESYLKNHNKLYHY